MAQNVISTNNILVANGGTGVTSTVAYSLQCGGTTTTASHQTISPVATGQVLVSGGVSALPAFSATPTVTSVNFGGTTLDTYVEGTWTPTIVGGTTAGTTTYTVQNGYYVRIGSLVWITALITITGMTGTGDVRFSNFPFTIKNVSTEAPNGSLVISCGTSYAWTGSTTVGVMAMQPNTTYAAVNIFGNKITSINLPMANVAGSFKFSCSYQI